MRHFTDSMGVDWTVFEVKRGEAQAKWLCFESRLGKRRLTRVPKGWREAGDDELEKMLRQAVRAGSDRPRESEMRE
jgi:hypothetical protein